MWLCGAGSAFWYGICVPFGADTPQTMASPSGARVCHGSPRKNVAIKGSCTPPTGNERPDEGARREREGGKRGRGRGGGREGEG